MENQAEPPGLDALDAASIAGRRFGVWRTEDKTGLSGTGWVMAGIVFADGAVATRWTNSPLGIATTTVWDSVDHLLMVHGHGGSTQLIYLDSMNTRQTLVPESWDGIDT